MPEIAGYYQHYKHTDNLYRVLGVGLDADTGKPTVIYCPVYPCPYGFFTRTEENFLSEPTQGVARFNRMFQEAVSSTGDRMSDAYAAFVVLASLCPHVSTFEEFALAMSAQPGCARGFYGEGEIRAIYWSGIDQGWIVKRSTKNYLDSGEKVIGDDYLELHPEQRKKS